MKNCTRLRRGHGRLSRRTGSLCSQKLARLATAPATDLRSCSYRYGDLNQADIIKLHKASGKVTFLIYDDFADKLLPGLQQRIKVNLRTRFVEVFDHGSWQLLYCKERFLASDDPCAARSRAFTSKLSNLAIGPNYGYEPSQAELLNLLEAKGLTPSLKKARKQTVDQGSPAATDHLIQAKE